MSLTKELTLQRQEAEIVEDMEGPETAAGAMQVGHEVNDHVEDEDSDGAEWKIGDGVGDGERGRTEEFVRPLLEEYGPIHHLGG